MTTVGGGQRSRGIESKPEWNRLDVRSRGASSCMVFSRAARARQETIAPAVQRPQPASVCPRSGDRGPRRSGPGVRRRQPSNSKCRSRRCPSGQVRRPPRLSPRRGTHRVSFSPESFVLGSPRFRRHRCCAKSATKYPRIGSDHRIGLRRPAEETPRRGCAQLRAGCDVRRFDPHRAAPQRFASSA